ncbi:hypothetical protein [Paenibacillus sp. sgz500958]
MSKIQVHINSYNKGKSFGIRCENFVADPINIDLLIEDLKKIGLIFNM